MSNIPAINPAVNALAKNDFFIKAVYQQTIVIKIMLLSLIIALIYKPGCVGVGVFFGRFFAGAGICLFILITDLITSITGAPIPKRCALVKAGIACCPVGSNTTYSPFSLLSASNNPSGT